MFGLPMTTSVVVFGFPLFWIVYTLVFLWRSRDWDDQEPGPPTRGTNTE
jgi:hypothetical protein